MTNAVSPAFASFEALAARFNSIPLVATLICDDMTPLSAFASLARLLLSVACESR